MASDRSSIRAVVAVVAVMVLIAVACSSSDSIFLEQATGGAVGQGGGSAAGAGSDAAAGVDDGSAGVDPDGSDGQRGGAGGSAPDAELPLDTGIPDGLDTLPPSDSVSVPTGWVLYGAWAHAEVGGAVLEFGGPRSSCSVLTSSDDQVILISNFQKAEARNLGPYLGYTDRGDGLAIWGLYIGQGGERGEEWSGTGQGTPTLSAFEGEFALIAPGGITFDPGGEGIEPDGRAILVVADWSGTANENFTAEERASSLQVGCIFVSSEIIHILAAAASRASG